MTLTEFLRFFPDVKLTDEQFACCRYLERKGQRFCVDFGYENAVDKAWVLLDEEVELAGVPQ